MAPFAIAATSIAVVLSRYSPGRIAAELARGEVLAVVPYLAGFLLVSLALVALADTLVIRGCTGRPRYRDVVVGKGGASLLAMLHYAAGHGAYGVWIAKKTGAPVRLASGIILYIMSSELVSVCLVTTASVWLLGADVPARLRIAAPLIAGVLVLLKLIGPLRLVARQTPLLEPWRRMSGWRMLAQLAVRVAQIYLMVVCMWAAAAAFGVPIPLSAMTAYLPVVLVVGSLPVNVLGFGAVQGAWLLFTPWASGPRILAFSIVVQLVMMLAGLLRGLPFVRRVVADIAGSREESASAEAV